MLYYFNIFVFLAGQLESTTTKASRGKDNENSSTAVSIYFIRSMCSLLNRIILCFHASC